MSATESDITPPATLRWAVGLVVFQAALVAAVTGFLVYEDVTAPATNRGTAVSVTVFAAGLAALLGWLGWALGRRRAWARGPALVLELLLVPMGWYMVRGGAPWLGVPVLLLGVAGILLLLAPATREALGVR